MSDETPQHYMYDFSVSPPWTDNPECQSLRRNPRHEVYLNGEQISSRYVQQIQTGPDGWIEVTPMDGHQNLRAKDGNPVEGRLWGNVVFLPAPSPIQPSHLFFHKTSQGRRH